MFHQDVDLWYSKLFRNELINMEDLFEAHAKYAKKSPLADRMRPRELGEFVGQEHLVGPKKILRRFVENRELV